MTSSERQQLGDRDGAGHGGGGVKADAAIGREPGNGCGVVAAS